METLRSVREEHMPVFLRESNLYANQQDKNELNFNSVYFVLEKWKQGKYRISFCLSVQQNESEKYWQDIYFDELK